MTNIQLTQYSRLKPSRVITIALSFAILSAPIPILAQELCAQQIMYGKNPTTGQWELLPNPCVIPEGWESSPTLPADSGGVDSKDITENTDTSTGSTADNSAAGTDGASSTNTTTSATSGGNTTPSETTTSPTEGNQSSGSDSGESDTTSNDDSASDCQPQITYAKSSETSQKWYLFSTPCDVPNGWIKADNDKICADVVVYAQNPTSKNWYSFVTPCDVPTDWTEIYYTKPENTELNSNSSCTGDVKYAQNLKTSHWYVFGLSCDAPSGADWKIDTASPQNGVNIINPKISDSNQCPPTLTYAQHPTSKHWYAFATPCDVPANWEKVGVVQQEEESTGESCEAFYASYSFTEGKLEIPRIWVNGLFEKPSLYEKIQMQHVGDIDSPNFSYFLFSFDTKMSLQPIITPSQ